MRRLSTKIMLSAALLCSSAGIYAQQKASVTLLPDLATDTISRNIYGQFSEHLGRCIYGGLWVGEDSSIPNTNGYRTDVLNALKELSIPVMRWPGGCFADEYHWTDGIGPRNERPRMVNSNWGGTVEDNSFGTHEFLNLCELLGCEPYISGNVGSGTVSELSKWVEYMTAEDGPMAALRKQNGREKPWKVKFLGVGNESWGCGGDMMPEYYANQFRRYATFCRDYNGNHLFKIASGASDYDYNWTKVLMDKVGYRMHGLSLHYYSVIEWGDKGAATHFTPDQYYSTLGKSMEIEDVIKKHIAIMDVYDSKHEVSLLVDEWGTWWDVEPGTNPGHLYQQNSMRDAIVASTTFNIFHKYVNRISMANIAQVANVLQSMVLTKDDKMVLTPTYYVFKMYKVHQDAVMIPLQTQCSTKAVNYNGKTIPLVSVTASRKQQQTHISCTNVSLTDDCQLTINTKGIAAKSISAEIITANNIADYNDFGKAEAINIKPFTGKITHKGDIISLTLPAKSIVTLTLQ